MSRLACWRRRHHSVDRFIHVYRLIEQTKRKLEEELFDEAVDNLEQVHRLLFLSGELHEQLEQEAHRILETEVSVIRERVLFRLGDVWNRMIKWNTVSADTVSLDLCDLRQRGEFAAQVARSLSRLNALDSHILRFADLFVSHFVHTVTSDRNILLQIIDDVELYVARISRAMPFRCQAAVPPAAEVFQKLEQIFIFLHGVFFCVKIDYGGEETSNWGSSLLEKFGSVAMSRVFECIYANCLSQELQAVRLCWSDFNRIAKLTENFEDFLRRLSLVAGDEMTLTGYLNAAMSFIGGVKSQELLKKAHEFVTQSLVESDEISIDHPLGLMLDQDKEQFVKRCKDEVGTTNYRLPTCQIRYDVEKLYCSSKNSSLFTQKCTYWISLNVFCIMLPQMHDV